MREVKTVSLIVFEGKVEFLTPKVEVFWKKTADEKTSMT